MSLPSESIAPPPVRLVNPLRYLAPGGTAVLAVLMFLPPLAFVGLRSGKVIAGVAILILSVIWLLRSAWRAPFEMKLTLDGLAVRRASGWREYSLSSVRKWWFAVPDGAPTQSPPTTNGVLYVVLDDGTRFRAEVTAAEATEIARILAAR